jgi:ParB-like chromosome segregation protein Spo0J
MSAEYDFHPFANRFPLMTQAESNDHVADIKTRGLLDPIVLFEGMILDGRNRYRSCAAAGIEPRFEEFSGDREAAIGYVISKNLRRRELTASQKAAIALDFEKDFADLAKRRQREAGGDKSQEALEALLPQAPRGREKQSRDRAAEAMGVGSRYVSDAKKIEKASPETLEKVRRGEKSIGQAKKDLGLTKPKPESTPSPEEPDDEGVTLADIEEEYKEREAIKAEIPDDEWLRGFDLYHLIPGDNLAVFTAEAIRYRRLEQAFVAFKKANKELEGKHRGKGPLHFRLKYGLNIKHPREWKLCGADGERGCDGTGKVDVLGNIKACSGCHGGGYKVS